MDLNSSELPAEIKIIVIEDTKKKKSTKKTTNIPANYVLEMHGINDRDSRFMKFCTVLNISSFYRFLTSFINSEERSNTVCKIKRFSNVRNSSSSR